jgi:hypothetical protein
MEAVPLHLKEANDFVRQYHRHSLPTEGGKFAIGCVVDHGTSRVTVPHAGVDEGAKHIAASLAADLGFEPVERGRCEPRGCWSRWQ